LKLEKNIKNSKVIDRKNKMMSIRFVIQTDHEPVLKKFPWHKWDLCANIYTRSEIARPTEYKQPSVVQTSKKTAVIILPMVWISNHYCLDNGFGETTF
jgi:hypothetical protein